MDLHVGRKYRMDRKIGSGSFGDVYAGVNMTTGEKVAIKVESSSAKHPQLMREAKVYRALAGIEGIPRVRWSGEEGDTNIVVMDRLGGDLESLFDLCGRQFTLKTVLMLAEQLLTRIEAVHSKGIIHRDIKPDNFLIGNTRDTASTIYLIDFGLAKLFKNMRTMQHIPYREGKNLTGTARYASVSTHLGIEQSRRDDLEGLAYVFIYMLRGKLPWQGLKAAKKQEKYAKIMECKMATTVPALCNGLPEEFADFLTYTRNLRFADRPDYEFWRSKFQHLFQRSGYVYDNRFDWVLVQEQRERAEKAAAAAPPIDYTSKVV